MTHPLDSKAELYPWRVEQYQQMIEVQLLTEADQVELLDGQIIRMSPVGRKHAAIVDKILHWLRLHQDDSRIIRVQSPIITDEISEPEPDICLLKWKDDFYNDGHPKADDVLLIIEVADSSLEKDRTVKKDNYNRNLIPEYWILNIEESVIEVSLNPSKEGYKEKGTYKKGEVFDSPLLGAVKVENLLI